MRYPMFSMVLAAACVAADDPYVVGQRTFVEPPPYECSFGQTRDGSAPEGPLDLSTQDAAAGGRALAVTDPAMEPFNWMTNSDVPMAVSEETPLTFLIYGLPDHGYCLHFLRFSGYMTLSHDEGEVRRDGDTFHFCSATVDLATPLSVTARALTPEITFSVWLERRL